MNKLDRYFANNPNVFYFVVSAFSLILGIIAASCFDFKDVWQYILIMGYPVGLFVGEKTQQYKTYANQQSRQVQSHE